MSILRKKPELACSYATQELLQCKQAATDLLRRRDMVLVHQMGKVGSTSLLNAINSTNYYSALQTHRLSSAVRKERHRLAASSGSGLKYANALSYYILLRMRWEERVVVIAATRDPVARYASDFFHNLENYIKPNACPSIGELIKIFVSTYPFNYFDFWFTHDFERIHKVSVGDFVQMPWGLKYLDSRKSIVVLKAEMENDVKSEVLSNTLGASVHVDRANELSSGQRADMYRQFTKALKLESRLLDEIYGQRWVKAVYSESEITSFRARWRA